MIRTAEPLRALRDAALRRRVMALCVLVLLVKFAVPVLALWAARINDVPVGDICSVYGLQDLRSSNHHPAHEGGNAGDAGHEDHCALAGVLAASTLLAFPVALLLASSVWPSRSTWQPDGVVIARDGPRDWRSRLAHAPPCQA